jgi:NADH-quinone oxidoreductase subunit L
MVQYDIKRVIAYSTLSQLGYMTVALGASAYSVAIFHLMTHAFFKAVLFLGAGSVIIALHHEQDMRKMGGLRKYLPVTYLTVLIGALANAGFPPFAGFFSKDSIIEAVQLSHTFGSGFAWLMVTLGVFVGGFYSFRLVFFAFHGKERFDAHHPPHESPLVVTVPLVLLAIPSVVSGWVIGDLVFGGYFGSSIFVAESHHAVKEMAAEFHGVVPMMLHGLASAPFWLALAGAAAAWYLYIANPAMAAVVRARAGVLVRILDDKYGFDRFNDWFFAGGARKVGTGLWRWGDVTLIDGLMVNGSAKLVGWFAGVVRELQSGYIYHYAFVMIIGVVALLWLFGSALAR